MELLRVLGDPSVEELESWLTQQVQDQLGTFAPLLRAVAWARRGAYARARADVDAALARQPAYELVELIAALILYVTRDYDRALTLLAKIALEHEYLAAQTLRALETRAARLEWSVERRAAHEQLAVLGVRDLRAHIHGLQRARASVDPRAPEAAAQQLWASLEHAPAQLGEQLDQLMLRAPNSAMIMGLRARLHLRLGELDRVAPLLASADHLAERWAYWLAGARAAQVVAAALPQAPSVRLMLLRAEALLELGALEPAAGLVAQAIEHSPRGSAGATLLAILIDARAQGRGPSRERFAELDRLAPGLLSDAARELELELWRDDGLLDDPAALLRCCEQARRMLSADRSSRLWYRTRSGDEELRLRCVPDGAPRSAAHEHDREDLEQAARLLVRAIDKRRLREPTTRASRAGGSRSSPIDLERFMADGHLHLRRAFPREVAVALVRDAQRRLVDEPERWLRADQASSLRGYDPGEPRTWPEGRVDLLGDRRFAIAEFSPVCEQAIAWLLGGPQRVASSSWTNSLIVNFPTRAELEAVTPAPDWPSWHLDAPRVDTRLDNLRAGLLVFILFADLGPRSGNTWLALDSPAQVARALAAEPAGVDFCQLETAPKIASECQRFVELTGEAGDIVLVHPLMLHSASRNPSPRIRWLGNPMVYVEGSLDHRRTDASPVEQVIARALRE